MATIQIGDEIKRKPAKPTPECMEMLAEALDYIEENSPKQAKIMLNRFNEIARLLEIFPEIGTLYKNGLRKFKLGKFRYNIYYRIKADSISIVGIWHTSRGTEFQET
jgi:plasmid stabilization system protein ParE